VQVSPLSVAMDAFEDIQLCHGFSAGLASTAGKLWQQRSSSASAIGIEAAEPIAAGPRNSNPGRG
jgi:hypothetical protein